MTPEGSHIDPMEECSEPSVIHCRSIITYCLVGFPYIRVIYNISLTWIKAIWGWFPLLTMIPVRSQWGRYNLPRYILIMDSDHPQYSGPHWPHWPPPIITNQQGFDSSSSTTLRWLWGANGWMKPVGKSPVVLFYVDGWFNNGAKMA